jgi:monothiol glutaredoxin
MDDALKSRIDEMVNSQPIFLFMKGNPDFPMCGFSGAVVAVLQDADAQFSSFDVLSDPSIRQGIKEYANWPTIPQLYIKGEFVGGCDIVREMYANGELQPMLQGAAAS